MLASQSSKNVRGRSGGSVVYEGQGWLKFILVDLVQRIFINYK